MRLRGGDGTWLEGTVRAFKGADRKTVEIEWTTGTVVSEVDGDAFDVDGLGRSLSTREGRGSRREEGGAPPPRIKRINLALQPIHIASTVYWASEDGDGTPVYEVSNTRTTEHIPHPFSTIHGDHPIHTT